MKQKDEFLKTLGKEYEHLLENDGGDYDINWTQMEKLINVIKFLKELGGEVEPVKLSPVAIHGGVSANLVVFDTYGATLEKLHEITAKGYASAFSVDPINKGEGVCASVTIPNLFKEINK